jgi:hypothetical protein
LLSLLASGADAAEVSGAALCGGTCRPTNWSANSLGSVLNVFFLLSKETCPPLNFWVVTSPSVFCSATGTPIAPAAPPNLSQAAFIAPRTGTAP